MVSVERFYMKLEWGLSSKMHKHTHMETLGYDALWWAAPTDTIYSLAVVIMQLSNSPRKPTAFKNKQTWFDHVLSVSIKPSVGRVFSGWTCPAC